jgi:hypothetical protein
MSISSEPQVRVVQGAPDFGGVSRRLLEVENAAAHLALP